MSAHLPIAMIGHQNQNGSIQKAIVVESLEPFFEVIIGNTHQIDRIVREFAVKAEGELWPPIAIGLHELKRKMNFEFWPH